MKKTDKSVLTQIIMQLGTSIECLDSVRNLLIKYVEERSRKNVKASDNPDN